MNIFKSSIIYIASDAVFEGLSLLLFPLISYYITPDKYGLYTNFIILVNFYSILVSMGNEGYVGVNFYLRKYINNRDVLFKNAIQLSFILTISILVCNIASMKHISEYMSLSYLDIFVALIIGFIIKANALFLTKLRYLEKTILFAKIRIIQSVIRACLIIFFVVCLKLSWRGCYLGYITPVILLFVYVLFKEGKSFFHADYKKLFTAIKEPFVFGISLLPHSMSSWIKTGIDKILLTNIINLYANGIYSTAFQFSLVLSLLGVGFNKAFSPYMFKNLTENNFSSIIKVLLIFIASNLTISIICIILFPVLIRYFFSASYQEAIQLLPYLVSGQFFLNLYILISNTLFFYKKTWILSGISVFTAFTHVLLVMLFINKHHTTGVSMAFCISSLLQMGITVFFSIYYMNKTNHERNYRNI